MNIKRIFAALLCMTLLFHCGAGLASDAYEGTGFELIETKQADDFGGTIYYFRHRKTGAQVVYLDNGSSAGIFPLAFVHRPPTAKEPIMCWSTVCFVAVKNIPQRTLCIMCGAAPWRKR